MFSEVIENVNNAPISIDWLIPALAASIGLIGALYGAQIGAASSVRLRLIDIVAAENADQRKFQMGITASASELYLSMTHRVKHLHKVVCAEEARSWAQSQQTENSVLLRITPEMLNESGTLQRAQEATTKWRTFLTEAQLHTGSQVLQAAEGLDAKRAAIANAVNLALEQKDVALIKEHLDAALELSEELGEHQLRDLFRALQVEKFAAQVRLHAFVTARRPRQLSRRILKGMAKSHYLASKLRDDPEGFEVPISNWAILRNWLESKKRPS